MECTRDPATIHCPQSHSRSFSLRPARTLTFLLLLPVCFLPTRSPSSLYSAFCSSYRRLLYLCHRFSHFLPFTHFHFLFLFLYTFILFFALFESCNSFFPLLFLSYMRPQWLLCFSLSLTHFLCVPNLAGQEGAARPSCPQGP